MGCYICSQNTVKAISPELGILISRHVIISEIVNSGGRDLIFKHGGRIHLDETCDNCDQIRLQRFLLKADILS